MRQKTFFTKHSKKPKHPAKRAFSMMVALTMAMTTFTLPSSMTAQAAEPVGSIKITKKDVESNLTDPQGDGDFTTDSYQIINNSGERINWKGVFYDPGTPITTISTKYDKAAKVYAATITGLPYGTYTVKELIPPKGYHAANADQEVVINEAKEYVTIDTREVFKGGVSITKADADLNESTPQGDATLAGVEYEIVNRSVHDVFAPANGVAGNMIAPGGVVMKITTAYDNATQTYVASTGAKKLAYGTYEIRESKASEGYTKSDETYTFSITADGQMHYFDNQGETENDEESHHGWNTDNVARGDVLVGKRDRDTAQYINLGGAHLDGSVFEIVNKSANPVVVNGETFEVGDVVATIASDAIEKEENTLYAALSGDKVLPYGTYDVYETVSGDGYLYDNTSKRWKKSFRVREDGEVVEVTSKETAVYNKVMREDFHFIKKTEDGSALGNVPFIVESMTTGEKHVIVTDETGSWGSDEEKHSDKTNANDPTSPLSNGAIAVNDKGEWYVADESKLDSEAGIWFTGLAEDKVTWAEDGQSYTLNGVEDVELAVDDARRALVYDTYKVQELRCEANKNYNLVTFTVKLHRYSKDHNGNGIDLDFGTVTDKWVAITTNLANPNGIKVAQADTTSKLIDTVTYENLTVNHDYTLKGELHLVDADGKDEGVVATAEKAFTTKTSLSTEKVEFELDTTGMGGKKLVAFETLMDGTDKVTSHEDLEDEDQTVLVPSLTTTLTGDLDHMANPTAEKVNLQDEVTYNGIEVGKTYEVKGALIDKATGEAIKDKNGKEVTTTAKFAAEKATDTVNVNFSFEPDESLAGITVVATETLTLNGVEYVSHVDLEDENQMVYFPKVNDNLTDKADNGKDIAEDIDQNIEDIINVASLRDGYDYTLVGTLYLVNPDGTNAGKLLDAEGNALTAKATWTGAKPEQTLSFKVDTSKLGGYDIAVLPTLYGKRIKDTKADDTNEEAPVQDNNKDDTDADDADPDANNAGDDKSLLDKFKDAAEALLGGKKNDDAPAEDAKEAPKANAKEDEEVILYSTDKASEGQLVHVPHIDTTFVTESGTHSIQLGSAKKFVATDTIAYTNLIPGKEYKLDSSLHTWKVEKKEITDGGLLTLDKGTSEISDTFIPEEKNGTVDVVYTFDGDLSKLNGQTVTAFEVVSAGEKALAKHEDITDEDQTIRFVDLDTVLTSTDGAHELSIPAGENKTVTLKDVVTYKGLVPNQVYTITGTLHAKEDTKTTEGKADEKQADVEVIKTETPTDAIATTVITFKPLSVDGQMEVTFTFDASKLAGKSVVAFETITSEDGKEVMSHKDMTDEDQTVHFISVTGEALASNGLHMIQVTDEATVINDTITYQNLTQGVKYTAIGSLHIQSTDKDGKLVDGGEIKLADDKSKVEFTPDKANGSISIPFTFDGKDIKDKAVVAFVQIVKDDKTVANLNDITNEAQTVHLVNITTKATFEDGSKKMKLPKNKETTVTVKDTVEYVDLIPGKEYTVAGELHVRSVGKEKITDEGALANADGTAVTGTATFTPDKPNGSVEVTFTFASTGLRGNTLVVFETVSLDGKELIKHCDINDDDQAVSFNGKKKAKAASDDKKTKDKKNKSSKGSSKSGSSEKSKAGKEVIKTGQISTYIFLGMLGLALMAGAGFVYFRRRI